MRIRSLRDLAVSVRGRRLDLGLSQAQLADRARVSRQWVNEFEAGKPTAEIALVLRVLDALDLQVALSAEPPNRSGLDDLLDDLRDD